MIDSTKVDPLITGDPVLFSIYYMAATQHEEQHISDALRLNPGIFNTTQSGLVLVWHPAQRYTTEVAAYQVQQGVYNQFYSAGSFYSQTLTSGQMTILNAMRTEVQGYLSSFQQQLQNLNGPHP